jgi:CRP-like cAMP-binding protein
MNVLRRSGSEAAERAREHQYAFGHTLRAMRLQVEAGQERDAVALACRCAAVFGVGPEAGERLVALARRAKPQQFTEGEVIVREGDRADACYVVMDGAVLLERAGAGRYALLEAGDTFGEADLVRHTPRSVTAVAGEGGTSLRRLDQTLLGQIAEDQRGVRTVLRGLYRERGLAALGMATHWMRGLSLEQRRGLVARFEERRFRAGERLARAGDAAPGLCLVLTGKAVVRRGEVDGERLEPGAFFGEAHLLNDVPVAADVVAVTDVECLVLTANTFRAVMMVYPDLTEELGAALELDEVTPPPLCPVCTTPAHAAGPCGRCGADTPGGSADPHLV